MGCDSAVIVSSNACSGVDIGVLPAIGDLGSYGCGLSCDCGVLTFSSETMIFGLVDSSAVLPMWFPIRKKLDVPFFI